MSSAPRDPLAAHDELRSRLGRLELALGAVGEGIAWTDASGRIEWCNDSFALLAEAPPRELRGRALLEVLPLQSEGAALPPGSQPVDLAARGELFPPRTYELRRGQRVQAVELYGRRAESGGESLLLFVLREVTEERRRQSERARLHDELEEKVRELSAANRELETFSYSISHDLRGPVNAIQCFSALLLQDPLRKLEPKERESLGSIQRMADRIMELIEGLLALAGAGHREPSVAEVDMGALAAEVVKDLRAPDGREVRWDLQPLPPARGDRAMLRQVLVNLLSNALKYTARSQPALIEVGGRREDGGCRYWVKDNGAGFDPERAGRLFEPFQRLHSRHQFEGTGVGLTIVRRVIEKHGGEVRGEGRPGGGATFTFFLPS